MCAPRFVQADIGEDAADLAARADGVFDSRREMCEWLACALQRRANGAALPACSAVSAAACAVRFGAACPHSSSPAQFVRLLERLPTSRLEALLALSRHGAR
ncbi:MAG TPA: hypothetical protein VMT68_14700 [Caulobacteraceae bacterium]|nr:hypothetical protein [Caulobacteraceae bacterium]